MRILFRFFLILLNFNKFIYLFLDTEAMNLCLPKPKSPTFIPKQELVDEVNHKKIILKLMTLN